MLMSLRFCPLLVLKLASVAARARNWYRSHQPDSHRAEAYRAAFYAEVWQDAATHFGASVELLGNDILEIRSGRAYTRVRENTTAIDNPMTLAVASNKPLVYRLLADRGLRVPNHLEFKLKDIAQAAAFIARFGGVWVVKPANGAGGRGVTTGVISTFDLVRAAVAAAAYEPTLLVEQQFEGDNYRLLYLDGVLVDAVLRKRPMVVSDGRSSIRKLIGSENRARVEIGGKFAYVLISKDMDMRRTLAKQGLSLSSVPKKGTVVTLKNVINENSARDNLPATRLLCDSIIEDGAAAANAVGARLAAVDVVTRNPAVPLGQSGGVILEVNTTPGYHCHYYRQGEGCPVALEVLSAIFGSPIQPRPHGKPEYAPHERY
jgi:glutathione synthase/RimK-type ligase-like ATP-grasp enzyme